jgi:hypothetical protein
MRVFALLFGWAYGVVYAAPFFLALVAASRWRSRARRRAVPEPTSDADRTLVRDVADHGWHVMNVLAEGGAHGWSFTIGLHRTFDHPEIAVFGLPKEVANPALNFIGEGIRGGRRFVPGELYFELLEGVLCTFRPIAPVWYRTFLGHALWFYGGAPFPALQLVWPDKSQRFPCDEGFRQEWRDAQPLLADGDERNATVRAFLRDTLGATHP